MNIQAALKTQNIRLSNSGRWLYWDEITKVWVVNEKGAGKKQPKETYRGDDEESAVYFLIR